jgi:hypothetical protein
MLRTLTIAFRRRHWDIPPGVTHVLTFSPPRLLEPPPDDPAWGIWELLTLGDFLAGGSAPDTPGQFGTAGMREGDLQCFAEDEIGSPVHVTRFEFEIEDGGRAETVPAYWLTPAGGDR